MFDFLKKEISISAPVKGNFINIEDVKDTVFSTKMMGDGRAIDTNSNTIYSPVDGEIINFISPSFHAFGIKSKEGAEILVHVGLDSVNLKGEGFKPLKKVGDFVSKGEKILEIDLEFLKSQCIDLTTLVVLINNDKFFISDKKIRENILFKIKKI